MESRDVEFWVYHGGSFEMNPELTYVEGECTTLYTNLSSISVDFLTKEVVKMGYNESRIKCIYYSMENTVFHESLIPIEDDSQIVEVARLLNVIRLYVEHQDMVYDNVVQDGESDEDDEDYVVQDDEFAALNSESDYDSNSDVDDEDVIESRKKIQTVKDRLNVLNSLLNPEVGDVLDDDSEIGDSPSEDSEEEVMEEGHKKNRVKKRTGVFRYTGEVELVVGAQFNDKEHFRRALDNYRIVKGYSVKVKRSNKKRMQAVCMGHECEWTCWAAPQGTDLTWTLKTVTKPHTCIPFTYESGKRHMTSDWLCDKYLQTIRDIPGIKVRQLMTIADRDLDMKLTKSMCTEARRKAKVKIQGDYRGQFGLIRKYCHEVASQNPGSTIKLKTDLNDKDEGVFKALYMCVDSLRKGFMEGCRKVVSLDACFLKGPWDGQVLAAVGRDANNQMYPIAWGVAASESTETWRWFIELLSIDLEMGNGQGWTIISDQQKGLINAVNHFLPRVEHRLCARHVYANIRKWWRGLQYRNVFWKLAKSSNEPHFNKYKAELQNLNMECWEFIEQKKPEHFCRRYFNIDVKCDSVDNNMAEVFNKTIVEARFMPIVTMLDEIYTLTMTRVAKRLTWAEKLAVPISPRIMHKLELRKQKTNYWTAHEAGNGLWSVRHGLEGFFVSINNKNCSCGNWQLSGIPCIHAIAVFRDNRIDPYTCVHECYDTELLRATYKNVLHPINGMDMWTEPAQGGAPIVAPFFKLKRNGLRTNRIPEAGEGSIVGGRVSKSGSAKHCSRCKKRGHNKTSCKEVLPQQPTSEPETRMIPTPGNAPTNQQQPSSEARPEIPIVLTQESQTTPLTNPLQGPVPSHQASQTTPITNPLQGPVPSHQASQVNSKRGKLPFRRPSSSGPMDKEQTTPQSVKGMTRAQFKVNLEAIREASRKKQLDASREAARKKQLDAVGTSELGNAQTQAAKKAKLSNHLGTSEFGKAAELGQAASVPNVIQKKKASSVSKTTSVPTKKMTPRSSR